MQKKEESADVIGRPRVWPAGRRIFKRCPRAYIQKFDYLRMHRISFDSFFYYLLRWS